MHFRDSEIAGMVDVSKRAVRRILTDNASMYAHNATSNGIKIFKDNSFCADS